MLSYYQQRLATFKALLAALITRIRFIGNVRLLIVCLSLLAAFMAWRRDASWIGWLSGGLFAAFLVLVRVHTLLHERERILKIRITLIEGDLAALSGNYLSFAAGDAYVRASHPYTYDLDIFGKGSIYQMLCRSTTLQGAGLLAQRLQQPETDTGVLNGRQTIVGELSSKPEFLEDFRVAGLSAEEGENGYGILLGWLQAKDDFAGNALAKIAAVAMPVCSLLAMGFAIAGYEAKAAIALVVLVNWIVLGAFNKRIKSANDQIGKVSGLIEKYRLLIAQLAAGSFTSPALKKAAELALRSEKEIAVFYKLVRQFDSRNNGMVGPLMNTLFLYDIINLVRLERWRKGSKDMLLETLEAVIDLDAMVGCAVYAYQHPGNAYTVFTAPGDGISAENLRHPLLNEATAVGNSFSLGREEKLYLLTGANMTGKSTFIRTLGVAVVLSYLGVPVPGEQFSMPLLNIYSSIRVTDSVQDDISYFKAEINRIKDLMTEVKNSSRQYLVLLDEPLRGTNSADKQMGTRSIIESLLSHNAVGIVATHDIGLADLEAGRPGQVRNYHFESKVDAGGLTFDFKLHAGPSTSNNATILMRLMGIIQ